MLDVLEFSSQFAILFHRFRYLKMYLFQMCYCLDLQDGKNNIDPIVMMQYTIRSCLLCDQISLYTYQSFWQSTIQSSIAMYYQSCVDSSEVVEIFYTSPSYNDPRSNMYWDSRIQYILLYSEDILRVRGLEHWDALQ